MSTSEPLQCSLTARDCDIAVRAAFAAVYTQGNELRGRLRPEHGECHAEIWLQGYASPDFGLAYSQSRMPGTSGQSLDMLAGGEVARLLYGGEGEFACSGGVKQDGIVVACAAATSSLALGISRIIMAELLMIRDAKLEEADEGADELTVHG